MLELSGGFRAAPLCQETETDGFIMVREIDGKDLAYGLYQIWASILCAGWANSCLEGADD